MALLMLVVLFHIGCIKPLCDLLEVKDAKVVIVALEGLENILRAGDKQKTNDINDIATMIDEADGVTKIQALQYHVNEGKIDTSDAFSLKHTCFL